MATGTSHASDATAKTGEPSSEETSTYPTLASPGLDHGQLRQLREDVKKAVEAQRSGGRDVDPGFDVHEALKATFEILANDVALRYSAQDQAGAFQTLANLLDLEALELSQDEQAQLAHILYDYWQSDTPNIHCRTLLDSLLAGKPDCKLAHLVPTLLHLLQPSFTPGNKAAIQILVAIVSHCSDEELEAFLPDLWNKLVLSLHEQTGAVQACKILVKLSIRWYTNDIPALASRIQPLLLSEAPACRQTVFENLLPPLLARFEDLFPRLSRRLQALISGSPIAQLSYLNLARCGVQARPSLILPETVIRLLEDSIIHADPLIRLEAIKLLTVLPGEKPHAQRIPLSHFALYRTFWTYSIQDSDSATFSTGLVGCWKALIVRCRTSSSTARRDLEKLEKQVKKGLRSSVEPEGIPMKAYAEAIESFLKWWTQLAVVQLAPSKPYRCQMNALKYLEILLREGIDPDYQNSTGNARSAVAWPFHVSIVTNLDFTAKLLHCLTSTYEDIKATAFNLLLRCPLEAEQISSLKTKALAYLKGNRDTEIVTGTLSLRLIREKVKDRRSQAIPGDSIETITLQDLLAFSQKQLALAKQDFAKAAADQPLHGCLSAINILLRDQPEPTRPVLLECLEIVSSTWTLARPHLYQEHSDVEEDTGSESIVTSAAWRAMKEVGDILCTALCWRLTAGYWSRDEMTKHAQLYETWLLEIEHRGAVAHISNAYGRLCSTVSKARNDSASLPQQWMESNLDKILLEERPMTRRSGGLPYLILGALCGSTPGSATLESTFHRLLAILDAEADSLETAKFHALNILRVLFLDGKLAQAAKPFLEQAFVVAVEGFGSSAWDVRNASLLLYAGLIQRVFGTRREHLPIHKRPSFFHFFSQNKRLHAKVLAELEKHQNSTTSTALGSVFSALLLLSLLQNIDQGSASQDLVTPFVPLVNAYSASRVWKVREAAAAAITGLTAASQTYETCDAILSSLDPEASQNAIQGKMLQVLHLVKTASEPAPFELPSVERLHTFLKPNNSPAVRTACLDILMATSLPVSEETIAIVKDSLGEVPESRASAREATFQRTVTQFLLKKDAASVLPTLLQRSIAAQSEALAYLKDQPQALNDRYLPMILQIMEAEHQDLGNVAKAAEVLSICPSQLLEHMDSGRIWRIYNGTRAPFVKDAVLPLLARLESDKQQTLQQLWSEGIVLSSQDESQSTRLSSCRAVSHLSPAAVGDYKHASLLIRFLQDEDMSIRHLAAATASKYYFDGQAVQSTVALDRAWARVLESSTASHAGEMYEEAFANLESLISDMAPQAGVLFAVEKINVYIDVSVDEAWLSKVFSKHANEIRTRQEGVELRLQQLSQTLEAHTAGEMVTDGYTGPGSCASTDLVEEAQLRLRTLSAVLL